MKATLEFNLDNEDDKESHLNCVRANEMHLAIWNATHNNKHLSHADIVTKMYDLFEPFNIE